MVLDVSRVSFRAQYFHFIFNAPWGGIRPARTILINTLLHVRDNEIAIKFLYSVFVVSLVRYIMKFHFNKFSSVF